MLSINAMNCLLTKSLKCCSKLQINGEMFVKKQWFLKEIHKNYFKLSLRVCHSNHNSLINENNLNNNNNNDINDTNVETKSSSKVVYEESDYRKKWNSEERRVATTLGEHRLQQRARVAQPAMPRLARVVLIGSPNAGKSTLTNQLVKWKVSSVSSKVHTTRHKVIGVMVEEDTQVEFLDTPGVVTRAHCAKHQLESTFMSDPLTCVSAADIIAVVSDASNLRERERLNAGIIKLMERHPNKESILILNKVDKINEKRKLLDITTRLTSGVVGGVTSMKTKKEMIPNNKRGIEMIFGKTEQRLSQDFRIKTEIDSTEEEMEEKISWNRFSHVFYTSALSGDGIEDIRQYFLRSARFQPWLYHRSQVTDQNPRELVKTTLRETFLDLLREEIPYKIGFVVTMWHLDELGNLFISVNVLCPQRFQSLVIGPKGKTIANVVQICRESLSNTFHCDVCLKLIVKGVTKH